MYTSSVSAFQIISIIVLCCVGCSDSRQALSNNLEIWVETLSALEMEAKELEENRKEAQSFIDTAEVHQVTRTEEEKALQLLNLNSYMGEIVLKIDSTQRLISLYKDLIESK